VIGFGVLAFAVVLIHRAYEVCQAEDDLDKMRTPTREPACRATGPDSVHRRCAVAGCYKSAPAQRWIGVIGTGALLAPVCAAGTTRIPRASWSWHMGNWPAPFGIVLVSDLLGAIMTVLAGIMGFAVALLLADHDQ
jgi:hypothetical protein